MPKPFLSATSITTGLLTTLAASLYLPCTVWAAGPSAFSQANSTDVPAPWRFVGLPERYAKPPTAFDIYELDSQKVLRVRTDKSYGNVVHDWKGPLSSLKWRWRLDQGLPKADLSSKKYEDIALKICLSFDMPVELIPEAERNLFKLAQLFSRDKLPTATLCYVWAARESVNTELTSPYTGRVHYIVVNTGDGQLKTWQEHNRNVSADFLKAFSNESGKVPAVNAIIVGADADNTQGASLGYVGDITISP